MDAVNLQLVKLTIVPCKWKDMRCFCRQLKLLICIEVNFPQMTHRFYYLNYETKTNAQ